MSVEPIALNPDALMAAYEDQHAHNSDAGRKGSGLEKAIRAYLSAIPSPLSLQSVMGEDKLAELLAGLDDYQVWSQGDQMQDIYEHPEICDEAATAIRSLITRLQSSEAQTQALREALERIADMEGTAGFERGRPFTLTQNGQSEQGTSRVGAFANEIARATLSSQKGEGQ